MRRRLKNYVAVVMSLLLCLGVWFQHGQMVKAEDEILATIIISTGAEADIYLEGIPVKGFSSVTTEDGMTTYVGSLSLTQEQIEAVDADERYLMYWYATDDRMEDDTIAVGTSPAIDLSRLFADYITCEEITGEDGSVTYDRLTITLFASYGASHKVAYDSNYQMGGYINSSVSDVMFFVFLGAVILMIIIVNSTISKPAKKASGQLGEIIEKIDNHEGDLTERIYVKSQDEVGQLVAGVNNFIEQLQGIMLKIRQESTHMNDLVNKITIGSK